jgi:hypothetical protein
MTMYNLVFKCTIMYTYVVNIYPCIHIEHKYYFYTLKTIITYQFYKSCIFHKYQIVHRYAHILKKFHVLIVNFLIKG